MSTVRTNNVQVGQSLTATNNFTLYQPTVPDGTVRLGVGNTGATTLDVITANSSGNVGLGTSSPSGRLNVAATAATNTTGLNLTGSTTGYQRVLFSNTTGGGQLGVEGSTGGTIAVGTTAYATVIGDYANNPLQFTTNNTVRTTLDTGGRLLINLTSSISSAAVLQVQQNCLSGVMTEFNDTDTTNSNNIIRFRKNGTEAGKIVVTTSNTTQYVTSSDYRLKENVQPMSGALARVVSLKPCTYAWKSDGSAGEGFIAHELQEVCPSAVSGEKDAVDENGNINPQGIDTSFLVATLTAAIQELSAKVAALEERLASTGQTGQNPV